MSFPPGAWFALLPGHEFIATDIRIILLCLSLRI